MTFRAALVAVACSFMSAEAAMKLLVEQHESVATYESIGVSGKGDYVVAATWLNEPEVVEVFQVSTGNKTIKSIGDQDPSDHSDFYSSIARDGTMIGVLQTFYFGNDFYSKIYGMDAASSDPGAAWNATLETAVGVDVKVSADGSLMVVSAVALNPNLVVTAYEGGTGNAVKAFSWTAPVIGATGGLLSVSDSGDYVAVLWGDPATKKVMATILDSAGAAHHQNVTHVDIANTEGQAFAISGDGKYLAAGQADTLVVYHQTSTSPLAYAPLFTVTNEANSFFVSSDCVTFGPDYVAVAWQSVAAPSLQPRITVFDLTSSNPATPSCNYTFPQEQGSYPNWPTGLAAAGDWIAYGSWGTNGNSPGSEAFQVFPKACNNGPTATFQTPGSMMAVGAAALSDGSVIAAAAGKHVHATVMGNGGDMYAIQVSS